MISCLFVIFKYFMNCLFMISAHFSIRVICQGWREVELFLLKNSLYTKKTKPPINMQYSSSVCNIYIQFLWYLTGKAFYLCDKIFLSFFFMISDLGIMLRKLHLKIISMLIYILLAITHIHIYLYMYINI